mmetsp:Transcript_98257/g.204935  ORF Transcript_98257/g.204935 Transcript_98257/m.204935 type:complete len:403 (-) Transcript_98257:180-1388(-)|eukprot:CAMPEP_0206471542 /NCGR_PEP_ID=MMETSP0324_2-20121206/31631_1 /ASSEMBLY_ACC=CAM_ASM_000836 /TAXON_ID=2866 /ORGANISM="Crypthecodinium cohnii, Strain Seligo" /LENGTH=402 /DNA_ID=CAMNT_0053945899 /DNA_START=88 /DNA_END=1296 /DNA_ORIENTATION=-
MPPSNESLQLNLLKLYERGSLTDVAIQTGGRELRAHKVILAAQSEWFNKQFSANPDHGEAVIQLDRNYKAVSTLIRFMYFGGLEGDSLGPYDGLDLLELSEELGVKALDQEELAPFVLPRLTQQNSIDVLQHPSLPKYPVIMEGVCEFVGANFLQMLNTHEAQLLTIPRAYLPVVLRTACHHVATDPDVKKVVAFCLNHCQIDSACDLLRDTKQWNWSSQEATKLKSLPKEPLEEAPEWVIPNVRAAMDSTPARIVEGSFFDWCIRLDYGAEGKLRIVYESATPRHDTPRCINRFPAAMFAWRVIYRGQDVFNEKPVFICFPENVSLHWSTTLPISAADLADTDDLQIMVNMAENPMLSLVLYYFSADLKKTVFDEDILNRLPHIEYRCLSSYSLVKTHVQP